MGHAGNQGREFFVKSAIVGHTAASLGCFVMSIAQAGVFIKAEMENIRLHYQQKKKNLTRMSEVFFLAEMERFELSKTEPKPIENTEV
jgi:hypothetical protein